MSRLLALSPIVVCLLLPSPKFQAQAEGKLVSVRVPKTKAWCGQHVAFFVELQAPGTFVGAASFSLPEIPRTVVAKVGNAVVSSKEVDGKSIFIQTHEFALFSQAAGTVKLSGASVRFSNREGFVGPAIDHDAEIPEIAVEIKRPPGSEKIGFLVTTDKIEITQSWQPQPGSARQGDVFRRTIVQQASDVTGMAFAPPPTKSPAGVRVYLQQPQVSDSAERGDLVGKRTDTITYQLRQPGRMQLPAITYVWWNADKQEYGSQTLPAVTFDVQALPAPSAGPEPTRWITPSAIAVVALGLLLVGCAVANRKVIHSWMAALWQTVNPPHRVAARRLLRACRAGDAKSAESAWIQWRSLQPPHFTASSQLQAMVLELERQFYGPTALSPGEWQGTALAQAFQAQLRQTDRERPPSALPGLNPR